jgi:hypothetical protein
MLLDNYKFVDLVENRPFEVKSDENSLTKAAQSAIAANFF